MNRIFLFIYMVVSLQFSLAQKPVITSSDYNKWPTLGSQPIISNDGNYFVYAIHHNDGETENIEYHIQSTKNSWQMQFSNVKQWPQYITTDSKYFIFQTNQDELKIVKFGGDVTRVIPNVEGFNVANQNSESWLIYSLKQQPTILILLNLRTGKQREFQNVSDYWIHENGESLFIKEDHRVNSKMQSLLSVNIANRKEHTIWTGIKAEDFVFDYRYDQLAFRTGDSIWYHKMGTIKTLCIADRNTKGINTELKIERLGNFSKDGKNLFFYLKESPKNTHQSNESLVEIWSYSDPILRSESYESQKEFMHVISIDHRKVTRIEEENEKFSLLDALKNSLDIIGIMEYQKVFSLGNRHWIAASELSRYLYFISGETKVRVRLPDRMGTPEISPLGNYLVYLDPLTESFHNYEIVTGIDREFTKGLKIKWRGGILAWVKSDQRALVSDGHDLWLLDILGKIRPLNLTNGFGKKHNIVFTIAMESSISAGIRLNQKIILNAFNTKTKENGFYKIILGKSVDPQLLTMDSAVFRTNSGNIPHDADFIPIKARDADVYVVKRQSAKEAPNFFITTDFKVFKRVSAIQTEKSFNWYSTELHSWKSLNGDTIMGILYKPENFDPNKKYPVIFNFYEEKSDGLNVYLRPGALYTSCEINIPVYVSQGYLVFCADIHYKVGDPMQGTYDDIISAANYASSLPFVNKRKMGLQGCSWGGIQTDYLVSRSTLFAAACSASGYADWVSVYGSISLGGGSKQAAFETGQSRVGGSLWEKPEVYINNSAIFRVDKITTPILLMNNKLDVGIPYYDATAFFTGLRRMGKRAWLLSYLKGGHGLSGSDSEDFSVRMMQFFDHYLKDKPAPIWMLDINLSDREKKNGLELDIQGRTPGPGILTLEEQKKVDSLMTIKQRTVTLK